nr:hypothetical protein CFP56_17506 [Quercus suber]
MLFNDLSGDKKKEIVLAAKFFTWRSLNIEAVARMFPPIWRTRSKFKVSDAGNNVLLIAFDLEVDAEKVPQGDSWAFDRHLVALQRYDGSTPAEELIFNTTSFWVQIHNPPDNLLTIEAAFSIGETLELVESGPSATQEAMYMEAKECGGGVADNTDRFDDSKAEEQKKKKKIKNQDFEAVIRDIDEAINSVPVIAVSNKNHPKTSLLLDSNVLESKQQTVGPK